MKVLFLVDRTESQRYASLCSSSSKTALPSLRLTVTNFRENQESWIQMLINGFFSKTLWFYHYFKSPIYLIKISSKVSLHIERRHWSGEGSCPKYFCQNCQNLPLPNLKLFLKHFKEVHSYDGTELIPIKRKRTSKAGSHSTCLNFLWKYSL